MAVEKNFYYILGVSPDATSEEIRLAYRDLAKKHHPDRYYSYIEKNKATSKMQEINRAYAVLIDPVQRREYDRSRPDAKSEVTSNEVYQEKQKGTHTFRHSKRANMFRSIGDIFFNLPERLTDFDHPWRTWAIALTALAVVVFLLLELDYYLGLHWITSSAFTATQGVFGAILFTVVFLNPFILMVVWTLIAALVIGIMFCTYFFVGGPIFMISEGFKKGLGKIFYKTSDDSWRPIVDLSVRAGSLLILTVLAILFPYWTMLLLLAFPYNLSLLFGLALWIGETIAAVRFIYRAKTIIATTEILLRS